MMIRPQRCFIMPRSTARVRRNGAVRLTRDHLVPVLVLHAHEEIVAGDAGVVDQDVEPAQRRFGRPARACRPPSRSARLHGRTMTRARRSALASRLQRRRRACRIAPPSRPAACKRAGDRARRCRPLAPVTSARLAGEIEHLAAPSKTRVRAGAAAKRFDVLPARLDRRSAVSRPARCAWPGRSAPCRRRARQSAVTPPSPASQSHALAPAHQAGHLLDQQAADRRPDRSSAAR